MTNGAQNCGGLAAQAWGLYPQHTGVTTPETLESLREKLQERATHLRKTIQAVDAARVELDIVERMLQVTS